MTLLFGFQRESNNLELLHCIPAQSGWEVILSNNECTKAYKLDVVFWLVFKRKYPLKDRLPRLQSLKANLKLGKLGFKRTFNLFFSFLAAIFIPLPSRLVIKALCYGGEFGAEFIVRPMESSNYIKRGFDDFIGYSTPTDDLSEKEIIGRLEILKGIIEDIEKGII